MYICTSYFVSSAHQPLWLAGREKHPISVHPHIHLHPHIHQSTISWTISTQTANRGSSAVPGASGSGWGRPVGRRGEPVVDGRDGVAVGRVVHRHRHRLCARQERTGPSAPCLPPPPSPRRCWKRRPVRGWGALSGMNIDDEGQVVPDVGGSWLLADAVEGGDANKKKLENTNKT